MVESVIIPRKVLGRAVVYILDADLSRCEHFSVLFRIEGFETKFFNDPDAFMLASYKTKPHLVVMASTVDEKGTLPFLRQIKSEIRGLPVIVVETKSSVDFAVAAMKSGATDVLSLPLDSEYLLSTMRNAVASHFDLTQGRLGIQSVEAKGFGSLTNREREVLNLIANGKTNRETADELGISDRTVEVHRGRVMQKMGARNTADLMRTILLG